MSHYFDYCLDLCIFCSYTCFLPITISTKLTCISHSSGGSMSVNVFVVLCATDQVVVVLSIFLLIIHPGKLCAFHSIFIAAIDMTP